MPKSLNMQEIVAFSFIFNVIRFIREDFPILYNINRKKTNQQQNQMLNSKKNQNESSILNIQTPQSRQDSNVLLLKPQEHPEFSQQPHLFMPKTSKFIEPWTQDQQDALYLHYYIYGPKWVLISKLINKSDKATKNKFFSRIRKLGRKLSYIGKKILKPKNPIHQKMIFRAIEAPTLIQQPFEGYNELKQTIKQSLLVLAKLEQIQIEESKHLIEQIHKFNALSRTYNLKGLWKKQVKCDVEEEYKKQGQLVLSRFFVSSNKQSVMMNNDQIEEMYNARLMDKKLDKYSFWHLPLI